MPGSAKCFSWIILFLEIRKVSLEEVKIEIDEIKNRKLIQKINENKADSLKESIKLITIKLV